MSKSKWLACSVNVIGNVLYRAKMNVDLAGAKILMVDLWTIRKQGAYRFADKRTAAKYGTPVRVQA